MASISIIGAGNVGITLGLLFHRQGYEIHDICNRSLASAQKAATAIGAGRAVATYADMRPVDILIIATSDNALQTIAQHIATSPAVGKDTIIFHCSGATPSAVLNPLRENGATVASVHPVKTFSNPPTDAGNFAGTWCGIEGDNSAVERLVPIFESVGGKTFVINADGKTLYHAAIVFMCNYLFPLIEAGLRCYARAGVAPDLAREIVTPILHATVDNALRLGPGKAITGPIARGDDQIVDKQLRALDAFDPDLKTLYEVLGSFATDLALQKGVAGPEKITKIHNLLNHDYYLKAAS